MVLSLRELDFGTVVITGLIGGYVMAVAIAQSGEETKIEYARHPTLEILSGAPEAPLWGAPLRW